MEIKALLQNPAFVAKLKEVKDVESALKLFAEEGVSVTAEELKQLLHQAGEELSDEEMDNVAGGYWSAVDWVCSLFA